MTKRFTDTEKWGHAWFRKLEPKYKCAWIYLIDKCDHAGIWLADFEAMSFHIGEDITKVDIERVFAEKLKIIGDERYLIQSFIDFQYGELNQNNRVHKSVMSKIDKFSSCVMEIKGLNSPLNGCKDIYKYKDKDKYKDKYKEKEKDTFDLDFIYLEYPRKEGKKIGIARLRKIIKNQEIYEKVLLAVKNYASSVAGTETKFIKQFSSFVSVWEDYLEIGQNKNFAKGKKSVAQMFAENPFRGVEK